MKVWAEISWEDLNDSGAAAPENNDPANGGDNKRTSEDYSEQVLSSTPVLDILQELSSKDMLDAAPEEIVHLANLITDRLCEKIVPAGYGAPINRRVINWLKGRIRR